MFNRKCPGFFGGFLEAAGLRGSLRVAMSVLVPLFAAFLYAAGSLGMKQAMERGASSWKVMAVSNLAIAAWSLPLFFLFPGTWNASAALAAVLAGAALFGGRIFAVKALEHGDLSVVAPLLALKTLLVALLSMMTRPESVDMRLLLAAALATAGVALVQKSPSTGFAGHRKAVVFAAAASLLFAITDVIVQKFASLMGIGFFQPLMFLAVCLFVPFLRRGGATPGGAGRPMVLGSAVLGLQTTMVLVAIGVTGQATLVNIVYSTRALWGVAVDFFAGGKTVRLLAGWRIAGAVLLVAAVIVALLK